MNQNQRLDIFLSEIKTISRTAAKALIVEGKVMVDGSVVDKPSALVSEANIIDVTEEMKYAGRGGYKLEKAIAEFAIDIDGKVCIDIGASTGGFTDCMLQNGARKIYAIDVGHSQLVDRLKKEPRIVSLEKTDIRNDELIGKINEPIEFAAVDVSFISLTKIFKSVYNLMAGGAYAVCLVKPQFETGNKKFLNKRGIVTDFSIHKKVLDNVKKEALLVGFNVLGKIESPIKGTSGNIEYLLYIRKE